MKRCAIMQPTYMPWLGYFDLLDQSDVFILYDDVQLSKQSWQVRNRIKTSNGELFLSIPFVKIEDWRKLMICDAKTNESLNWRKKHLKSIENSYRRAAFFDEVFSFITNFYGLDYNTISSFNSNFIKEVAVRLGINSQIFMSSDIQVTEGRKDLRLANLCKSLHAEIYLSPQGSADYIEENEPGGELAKSGIEVYYHNYSHPKYKQLFGEFIPFMGILDLMFNEGFNNSLAIIRSGRREVIHYTDFQHNH